MAVFSASPIAWYRRFWLTVTRNRSVRQEPTMVLTRPTDDDLSVFTKTVMTLQQRYPNVPVNELVFQLCANDTNQPIRACAAWFASIGFNVFQDALRQGQIATIH